MCQRDAEDSRSECSRSRRRFLSTAGAVVAAAGLAGCSGNGVTDYEFRARPVVLSEGARTTLDYELLDSETVITERSRTISGVDITATVESQVTIYGTGSPEQNSTDRPDLGVVSTPEASVMGRSFNPLATRSFPNLLTGEAGTAFLRRVGLNEVGQSRERIRWDRGPTFLDDRPGDCLDTETTLESYAGILGGDPPSVAFVHLARAQTDSIVVSAAVHGRAVDDPERPFVDADAGYLSPAAFDAAVDTYADATEALTYEE